jgi:predicted ArsR family transcriptional regulator
MNTQKQRIREYIREHGSITPRQAMDELGVMRLAARISELIKDGDIITTEVVTDKNRYGQVVRYARYRRGF